MHYEEGCVEVDKILNGIIDVIRQLDTGKFFAGN
jgi:hypothetical protein